MTGCRPASIDGKASIWFTDPQVRVEEGVVILYGHVEFEELKNWAGDPARNTQDVVALVNRMEVLEPPVWDFRPASSGLLILWRDFIRSLPFMILITPWLRKKRTEARSQPAV